MAYLGLVHGAVGWQYFIRSAPVSFPYAAAAWGEVRQVAAEIAELTPAVLSGVKPPSFTIAHPLQSRAWQDHNGTVYVRILSPPPPPRYTALAFPSVHSPCVSISRLATD